MKQKKLPINRVSFLAAKKRNPPQPLEALKPWRKSHWLWVEQQPRELQRTKLQLSFTRRRKPEKTFPPCCFLSFFFLQGLERLQPVLFWPCRVSNRILHVLDLFRKSSSFRSQFSNCGLEHANSFTHLTRKTSDSSTAQPFTISLKGTDCPHRRAWSPVGKARQHLALEERSTPGNRLFLAHLKKMSKNATDPTILRKLLEFDASLCRYSFFDTYFLFSLLSLLFSPLPPNYPLSSLSLSSLFSQICMTARDKKKKKRVFRYVGWLEGQRREVLFHHQHGCGGSSQVHRDSQDRFESKINAATSAGCLMAFW